MLNMAVNNYDISRFKENMKNLQASDLVQRKKTDVVTQGVDFNCKTAIYNTLYKVSDKVYWMMNEAVYYANRNMSSKALSLAVSAQPAIYSGLSDIPIDKLGGDLLGSVFGTVLSLESTIQDSYNKVIAIKPTDYELLKLTGKDSKGRTEIEHNRDKMGFTPFENTFNKTYVAETQDGQSFQDSAFDTQIQSKQRFGTNFSKLA